MKITLLHYTFAPVVGGVESILEQHAGLFAAKGHEVRVVCGEGAAENASYKVAQVAEMRLDHPLAMAARGELDAGGPGARFAELKKRLAEKLSAEFENRDIVFLHNVMTMHFHLALTAALWELAERPGGPRFAAWIHDLAACNPDFPFPSMEREPWNLLIRRHPRMEYAAVSAHRRKQFEALTGAAPESCRVAPNGIDPVAQLGLSENVAKLALERGILEKDVVLLHPARLVKRKNIELGMRVAVELKKAGKSCCCMVTGAPDRHNPAAAGYHDSLLKLRAELGIADEFIFLHELFAVANRDLIGLYRLADALFFPSRQEGFGLPILEGGLHRLPIFCANIEPMNSPTHDHITYFSPEIAPGALAGTILKQLADSRAIQAGKAVVREYAWTGVYSQYLEPLLKMTKHE